MRDQLLATSVCLAAIEALYDTALNPTRWPDALQAVADVFADVGAVMVYSRDDGSWGAISSRSVEQMAAEQFAVFGGADLRAMRGIERGVFLDNHAVTDRHVVSDEEIETHPYYKLMAKHGLKYFVGVPASPCPTINVAISVQRAMGRPPYEDSELELLTYLGRHAEKALRLSIRLLDAESASIALRQTLSRLGIGVIAIDSLRRVIFRNSAADRSLGDGIGIVNNRLLIENSRGGAELLDAIERLPQRMQGAKLDSTPIVIRRRKSERPLIVYVLPINALPELGSEFLTSTQALILIIDASNDAPVDPGVVRDIFGLTLGEARVAAIVGSGLPPRDAAKQLQITEETARTALKRVFSKMGISRQSELSALLTRLVLKT